MDILVQIALLSVQVVATALLAQIMYSSRKTKQEVADLTASVNKLNLLIVGEFLKISTFETYRGEQSKRNHDFGNRIQALEAKVLVLEDRTARSSEVRDV